MQPIPFHAPPNAPQPPNWCERNGTERPDRDGSAGRGGLNGTGPRAAERLERDGSAGRGLNGTVRGPRSGLGTAEVPSAPVDPSRLHVLRHPMDPSRLHVGPRPHPGRRPTPKAADRPSSNRKRGVSPGLTLRRIGASDARRAKAKRISERARAWMARSERPEGQPRAHPERPTLSKLNNEQRHLASNREATTCHRYKSVRHQLPQRRCCCPPPSCCSPQPLRQPLQPTASAPTSPLCSPKPAAAATGLNLRRAATASTFENKQWPVATLASRASSPATLPPANSSCGSPATMTTCGCPPTANCSRPPNSSCSMTGSQQEPHGRTTWCRWKRCCLRESRSPIPRLSTGPFSLLRGPRCQPPMATRHTPSMPFLPPRLASMAWRSIPRPIREP